MEDDLATQTDAVFVEAGPAHDLGLEGVVDLGHGDEFPAQRLQHHGRGDAVGEEVVQLRTRRHDHGRRALAHNVPCDLLDEQLPVRRRDGRLVAGVRVLRVDGLEHQQGLAQVAARVFGDALVQGRDDLPVLLLACLAEGVADLGLGGRGDAHQQRPTADRGDDAGRAVRHQDQAHVGAVLLHCPSQRGLRVATQPVGLVDHHYLEPLLRREVHLLRLRHLFEKLLDHHPVVVAHIARRDLEVVDRRDDVEFEFAIRRRRKHACINFDLFRPTAIERAQRRKDTRLFPSARGTVE